MASFFNRHAINLQAVMDFSHLDLTAQKHLRRVYSTLTICTLLAAAGAAVHLYTNFLQNSMLTFLGSLGCLIALAFMKHTAKNLKIRFGLLSGFALFTGSSIGPLLNMAARISPQLIPTAFLLTAVVFISLSLCATLSKRREYLFLGTMLFSALSILSLMSFVNLFARSSALFDFQLYAGLLVFCGFVLFDTQLIIEKRRCGDDDFIWHALDLFIDAVDIFIRILTILSKKEDKKRD